MTTNPSFKSLLRRLCPILISDGHGGVITSAVTVKRQGAQMQQRTFRRAARRDTFTVTVSDGHGGSFAVPVKIV